MNAFLATILTSSAYAENCPELYTADKVQQDMVSAADALARGDNTKLIEIGSNIEKNIICMKTPAPPQVFGTLYRTIGISKYRSGDEAKSREWLRSAIEIDSGYSWSFEELPQDDPFRRFYDDIRNNASLTKVLIEDKVIDVDAGTKLWLDGRSLTKPEATTERPHVLFLANTTDKTITERHLIDGNNIPEEYLGQAEVTKGKGSEQDLFAVTVVQRIRPKGKTPLLVSGGLSLVTAAGLYGYSFATNSQFQDAVKAQKPSSELEKIRSKNNALVISSILIGGVGSGLTFTGVMLDGAPGMFMGFQF
jgi:hypothetical protein